jgi:hypothetical protein
LCLSLINSDHLAVIIWTRNTEKIWQLYDICFITYIPFTLYVEELAEAFQISNIANVTGGKPVAVWSQSISGVNAINPLLAFYDSHGRKREVLFFCPGHHTRLSYYVSINLTLIKVYKRWIFFALYQQYHCTVVYTWNKTN